MFWAAALARRRSLCAASRIRWSPVYECVVVIIEEAGGEGGVAHLAEETRFRGVRGHCAVQQGPSARLRRGHLDLRGAEGGTRQGDRGSEGGPGHPQGRLQGAEREHVLPRAPDSRRTEALSHRLIVRGLSGLAA